MKGRSAVLWILFFMFSVGVVSCHEGNGKAGGARNDSTVFRRQMIAELVRLKACVQKNDRKGLAGFISFPVADSNLSVFIEERVFKKKWDAAHGLTREMYDRYYDKLSGAWDLEEFGKFFDNLNLKGLMHKNKLEKEIRVKEDICYYIYSLEVKSDSSVVLFYGTNTNSDYKAAKGVKKDDSDEDDMGCPEHATIWTFRLEGGKLRLERQTSAG